MNGISQLRDMAGNIKPLPFNAKLDIGIVNKILSHRDNVLSCSDPEMVQAYIDKATYAECLSVLVEVLVHAPLNDDFSRIFVFLKNRVLGETNNQTDLYDDGGDDFDNLPVRLQRLLEDFRQAVRSVQLSGFDPTTFKICS